jgi:hypothetical protein
MATFVVVTQFFSDAVVVMHLTRRKWAGFPTWEERDAKKALVCRVELSMIMVLSRRAAATAMQQDADLGFTMLLVERKLLDVLALHQWACGLASTYKSSARPAQQSVELHCIKCNVHL